MNKLDKRAIKITELGEQLEEAKRIIHDFVWPPDSTREDVQRHMRIAAQFCGCKVPDFTQTSEERSSKDDGRL